MPDNDKQYYTVAEIAEITGLNPATIRKALARGDMPYVQFGEGRNSTMRVHRDAFWQWVASRTVTAKEG